VVQSGKTGKLEGFLSRDRRGLGCMQTSFWQPDSRSRLLPDQRAAKQDEEVEERYCARPDRYSRLRGCASAIRSRSHVECDCRSQSRYKSRRYDDAIGAPSTPTMNGRNARYAIPREKQRLRGFLGNDACTVLVEEKARQAYNARKQSFPAY